MTDRTPYLTPNIDLWFGYWTGAGFSAGRKSPAFDPLTTDDVAIPGVDAFDQNLSRPHDIQYDNAQQLLASQWDTKPTQRLLFLVNYFQALEGDDLAFLGGVAQNPSNYFWGELVRGISVVAFTLHILEAETLVHRLNNDPQYATFMTNLSKQEMETRLGSIIDVAGDTLVYWLAQSNSIASAVVAATTSLYDLVQAVNHGHDFTDQIASFLGSSQPGSVASVLDPVLQLLADRSGAIHQLEWASKSAGGTQANGSSHAPSISGDGRYVAFYSYAPDLIAGDTNGAPDIFLHDRQNNTTARISAGAGGAQANGSSFNPSISQDGRFVAFESTANNLVAGDVNGRQDIFVTNGSATTRVSVGKNAQGVTQEPNFPSFHPAISLDSSGNNYLVTYSSDASNLVAGDSNGQRDIFLYKSATQAVTRITNGNNTSDYPSISKNATIAFESYASNLVTGDTNATKDVFLFNGTINARISFGLGGAQANGASGHPSISADGNFVAFESLAFNLVQNDSNSASDIFVYDRANGTIERVSLTWNGAQADNDSYSPSISGDGRFVTFWSRAFNLVPDQHHPAGQIFVYDRLLDTTRMVSVSAAGQTGNAFDLEQPVISADGTSVAFESAASNLYRGAGGYSNIFETDALHFFTSGGPRDDVFSSTAGNDAFDGGGGNNTVSYAGIAAAVTVSLALTGPQNTGGAGTDTLTNFRNIVGGSGADRLTGDGMANSLGGGPGNDILNGSAGFDLLTGGTGNDKFVFDTAALTDAKAAAAVFDEVKDYAPGDQIDLSALLAGAYNHGSGQPVASLLRAIEDASGAFARLQIDPDGAANGANWTTIARLDGVRPGNTLNVILDSALAGGSAIGVAGVFGQPAVKLAAFNPANGWSSDNSFHRELADVNGDGMADIIGFGIPGVMVSLATGGGSFAAPAVKLAAFNPANGWTSDNTFHREMADVNGDGMADIVGFGIPGVLVSLATGGGNFTAPAVKLAAFNPANGWTGDNAFHRELADVNGDGMADIVGFGIAGVRVALATGGGNFATPEVKLAAFNPANGWTSNDQFPRELADVNGDGMADIVGFGNGGVYVALATGGGNFAPFNIELAAFNPANGWISNNQFPRELADVNGDGMADIVGFGNGGVYVAAATGGGHFAPFNIDIAAFNPANGWSSDDAFHRELADVNHDGFADVIGFGNAGVLVALANNFLLS